MSPVREIASPLDGRSDTSWSRSRTAWPLSLTPSPLAVGFEEPPFSTAHLEHVHRTAACMPPARPAAVTGWWQRAPPTSCGRRGSRCIASPRAAVGRDERSRPSTYCPMGRTRAPACAPPRALPASRLLQPSLRFEQGRSPEGTGAPARGRVEERPRGGAAVSARMRQAVWPATDTGSSASGASDRYAVGTRLGAGRAYRHALATGRRQNINERPRSNSECRSARPRNRPPTDHLRQRGCSSSRSRHPRSRADVT